MNTDYCGTIKFKEKLIYFTKINIESLINQYEGILSINVKENEGGIYYEFVIDKNHSSLIHFLELYDYKNVVYSIV